MIGLLKQLWWGGDPDAVNPLSGLTLRDVYAVQKSWIPVYKNPVDTGIEIFKRLIHANPEAKLLYRMVRNVPEDKMIESYQFRAHVITFASNLDLAVKYLNQPEMVVAMMNKQGHSHTRRKIQKKYFNILMHIMLNMFDEILELDDKTLASWEKTLKFLFNHIFETLQSDEPR